MLQALYGAANADDDADDEDADDGLVHRIRCCFMKSDGTDAGKKGVTITAPAGRLGERK